MLALGARGQLTCADVDWNAAAGYLNWSQAAEVLALTPGCALSGYATLVAIAASNDLACTDITWWEGQGSHYRHPGGNGCATWSPRCRARRAR